MNCRVTLRILGGLLLFLAAMLLTPLPFSVWYGDGTELSFLLSAAITGGTGMVLLLAFPSSADIGYREGFGIVSLGWIAFALFGALPLLLSGVVSSPVDAFFESTSGFTTTGATVFEDLDRVAPSILFWRAMTHWLGGMGIIVLSLAILPFLGVGGMQLYQAEVPGPTADRLRPRIEDTAKALWGVYVLLTALETALLLLGGLDFHEATCHAFATMATGGFSTRDASVGAYGSYVQVVVTIFMLLAGINFSLHLAALSGRARAYLKSQELRFFAALVGGAILVITALNLNASASPLLALRDASFQVASIATTTGFVTADYERWPVLAQYLLLGLMFVGGCAGSTGGGMKAVRALLVVKHAGMQVVRLIHPREVRVLRLDHAVVPRDVIRSILGFFALYMALFALGSVLMAAVGLDLVSAAAASIACLGNVGPGLGEVGPTDTYAFVPPAGKLILSALMLLGRLEIFTVLVLFLPSFWRR